MYCIFNYHWVNADHVIWAHAVGANRFCYFSSWRLQYMWSYGPVLLFSLIWKSFQHSNTLSPLTFKSLGNTQHIHGSQASITGSISHVPLNLSILLLIISQCSQYRTGTYTTISVPSSLTGTWITYTSSIYVPEYWYHLWNGRVDSHSRFHYLPVM